MKRAIIGILPLVLLTACASTKQYAPMATHDQLKAGNALIVVKRESGFIGGGRSIEITDNGVKTGSLAPGDSISWQRPEGPMEINLAPAALMVSPGIPIHVDVIAGQEYHFATFLSNDTHTFVLRQK